MRWEELDTQTQDDLLDWYNVLDVDDDDRDRLYDLYIEGNFHAWDCPECGDRVYWGEPEEWGLFQGVMQADYTSFPGDRTKYTIEYIRQMCDHCRMTK